MEAAANAMVCALCRISLYLIRKAYGSNNPMVLSHLSIIISNEISPHKEKVKSLVRINLSAKGRIAGVGANFMLIGTIDSTTYQLCSLATNRTKRHNLISL